ncbi:MAG TPA: efflux RND transporter periplasmic adaptor subunit, partial [Lacibacter sp.]|nr:efflux RND transporter periplasmic adaptor subunit [Lacibacter sp.]
MNQLKQKSATGNFKSFAWLCLLLIAYCLFVFSSCKSKTHAHAESDVYYTCSMDPQVIESKPGKCPICKMDLTPVKKSNGANKDEIQLSEQQIQLGNIQTDTIRNGTIGDQLVLTASLNFDQMKTSSVSARVGGRIERLYFKNPGDYVSKGAALYEIYSEELNNAKQEFILALERKKTFATETAIDFEQLLQSAKNKLLLWGMSEAQINELAKTKKSSPVTTFYSTSSGYITTLDIREGDYVMDGGTIVKLADLSRLWAEAQVYTSQMAEIDLNGTATVQLPDMDGKEINGRIEFVNPEINPDTRINLI